MNVEPAKSLSSRRAFVVTSSAFFAAAATGCGTLMHPERVGQTRRGNVDWTVVGLDAIGLCFFFIPGIIAFAVDFGNGAMFFPAEPEVPSTATGPAPSAQPANETQAAADTKQKLRSIQLPPGELTLWDLAQIASRETGRQVELTQGEFQTASLESIDDFWSVERRLAERHSAAS